MPSSPPQPPGKPLNIGFRVGTFPKLSETFVLSQIEGMIARGHNVSILADQRSGPEEIGAAPDGLAGLDYVLPASPVLAGLRAKLPYRVRRFLTRRHERALCGDNDVVICNFGWFGAQVLASARDMPDRARILTIFHGDDMSRSLLRNDVHQYDELIASGELLMPVSDFWAGRLKEFGATPNTIHVHRMGVKVDEFRFQPRTREAGAPLNLVTVCRFVEKKGLEYAIRGVGRALERMPDAPIRFELIGSGPLEQPLADLVRDLGLEDRVLFSGALPHKDVVSALERSDALILPSVVSSDGDMEGIPLSLMEAMASGVSVISTYHSGIPELIEHGVSGLLSEERNVDQVADNILTLLQNPEDAAKMAQQARLVIESKFNSDMLNDQLEKLCREAADRSQPAAAPGA